ncbi:methyltransferase domain-containing protein [Shewanella sp. WXL01]|uniref:methyltransferase domain-containing protein n=1 Tax=Shewanella sp. WXL01 TaxID=2709721 RepID=UPI0014386A83|nr:methyltransferase domain-containing protein [Shewanella sp. WXL01]NKF49914.1 methyltransferase domain-containing protein [Shewanella sp. WXL01]
MTTTPVRCPICQSPMQLHQASNGYYCDNKHRLDKTEQGFYPCFINNKNKPKPMTRAQMRAKQFLLASGLYQGLVDKLADVIRPMHKHAADEKQPLNWLDYQCGEGFYLRELSKVIGFNSGDESQIGAVNCYGFSDAENALFAASKQQTPAQLFNGSAKGLPFNDESFDLITVLDSQLKGKECQRVLKADGRMLLVVPTPEHLLELRQLQQGDVELKPTQLNLPSGLELVVDHSVQLVQDVSAEQAQSLYEQTSFGWRASKQAQKVTQFSPMKLTFAWQILELAKAQ